jgi:hypothetical protein
MTGRDRGSEQASTRWLGRLATELSRQVAVYASILEDDSVPQMPLPIGTAWWSPADPATGAERFPPRSGMTKRPNAVFNKVYRVIPPRLLRGAKRRLRI